MPRFSDDARASSERFAFVREISVGLISQATEMVANAIAAMARSSATVKKGHAISAKSQTLISMYRAGLNEFRSL